MTGVGGPAQLRLDLVLPVHNEADTIEQVLGDWWATAQRLGVDLRFVVCEDGSTDSTSEVLARAAAELPITLVQDGLRKGYSRAVVDGLRATVAPWVGCVDSDGQYDPADLDALLAARGDGVVVVGTRVPRQDPLVRRLMSTGMRAAFVMMHRIRLPDPSSPFCLMTNATAHLIAGSDPVLQQGYWWEFHIRRERAGVGVVSVPVRHRTRSAGTTRVYHPSKVPRLAIEHLHGLWRLRRG